MNTHNPIPAPNTPTAFRAIYEDWSRRHEGIPDSDILPGKPRSGSPRHRALATALAPLRAWRDSIEPPHHDQSNFFNETSDDEIIDDDGKAVPIVRNTELLMDVRPTVGELLHAVAGCADPHFTRCEPVFGPVQPLKELGGLRFHTIDGESVAGRDVPTRGSLKQYRSGNRWWEPRDELCGPKGPRVDHTKTNKWFEKVMNAQPRRDVERLPRQKKPKDDEWLPRPRFSTTGMCINTARAHFGLPPSVAANDNRPVMPWGPANARQLFMSCVCHRTGKEVNTTPPNNAIDAMERNERAASLRQRLSEDTQAILGVAISAANFNEVGEALSYSGKTAERHGKQRVLDAVEDLSTALAA